MSTTRNNHSESSWLTPQLAESISERSDQELMDILENPDDWRPEVVEFARAELQWRSDSPAQMDQKLVEHRLRQAEEFKKRSNVPMTAGQCALTIFYGVILGLLGLLFAWRQASRFKSEGFNLRSCLAWQLLSIWCGIYVVLMIVHVLLALTTK